MRIDRKRKFLGSIFLRALGMKSNEEILRTFYQVERITLRDGDLHWNLSEGLIDRKLSHEIKNPQERRSAGRRAQAHHRTALQGTGEGQGSRRRTCRVADLEGAYTVADLVNRQTGEVLLEANKPLTAEIWAALRRSRHHQRGCFLPRSRRRRRGPFPHAR